MPAYKKTWIPLEMGLSKIMIILYVGAQLEFSYTVDNGYSQAQ